MKLIKLTLSNFKGVKHLEFEPNGKNASVYGTNASGKTTLFDALTWLLFDKASTGEPGFSPKTIGADGKEVHNINNRVDGIFCLDNGQLITLSKDQSENWVKKRGNSAAELAGNTTEYYIDGVPVKKSEFDIRIAGICPTDKAQILTQPLFFSKMLDWRTRRKMLLEVCGDVSDTDVIESSKELKRLILFLLKPGTTNQFYTVEECVKIATARCKDIRKRLEEVPSRIDEATRALLDDTGLDKNKIEGVISILQGDLDAATLDMASVSESSAVSALRQQLSDIRVKMANGEAAFLQNKNSRLSVARKRLDSLRNDNGSICFKKFNLEENVRRLQNELENMQRMREELIAEYKSTEDLRWNGETVCRVCGQALPAEKIDSAKAKFNTERATKLESIRQRIEKECSKLMISSHSDAIGEATRQIIALVELAEGYEAAIEKAKADVAILESEKFEGTEEYSEFASKLASIEKGIINGSRDTTEVKKMIQAKIDRIRGEIEDNRQKLLVLSANAQQFKRIADLKAEEKNLHKELEDAEYCLHLCEEFIKTKVSMLDDHINTKFQNVRFRLFETQINGGIKECCDVMIPSKEGLVPFSDANSAAKLNGGLEIIDTLSSAWGIQMPVFVDNAESVVSLNYINSQVIRLIVSEADLVLRVEVAE